MENGVDRRTAVAALASLSLSVGEAAAQAQPDRLEQGRAASDRLIAAIRSVEGCLGVRSARTNDGRGDELIFAWFRDRASVLRWFEHSYHRQLLRDAGREEDHVAAQHFGDDVGPILVLASVAYNNGPGSLEHSMFDDPLGRRPARFGVEYYVPLAGGAFMETPFAPPEVSRLVPGLRDVYED